jgi:two-component system chemotaxis response regulator CheB
VSCYKLIVVGTSLGGLAALETLLGALPREFALPVAVVQHRGGATGDLLRATLHHHSAVQVREPQDKEPIAPGRIYLAPAGYHLLVEPGTFALSTEGPVCSARPSIDVLFASAAEAYGRQVVSVVLTGASRDGALGAARVKERGGCVVVQDPETAECPVMPRAALAATKVDAVLTLEAMARFLAELAAGETP